MHFAKNGVAEVLAEDNARRELGARWQFIKIDGPKRAPVTLPSVYESIRPLGGRAAQTVSHRQNDRSPD